MTQYEYACRNCGRQLGVDESTREAILASGCPYCAAPASREAFTPERS